MTEHEKYKKLAEEVIRLRQSQSNLKDSLYEYKRKVSRNNNISEEEKENLHENWENHLRMNAWMLKKIIYQIKKCDTQGRDLK